MNDSQLFVLGDADNVRKRVQGLLLAGELDSLSQLSNALTQGIMDVAELAKDYMAAEVIFSGGDDILFRADSRSFNEERLRSAMKQFEERTGVTLSFGIGGSAQEAYLNLARAKSIGPGTLVGTEKKQSSERP